MAIINPSTSVFQIIHSLPFKTTQSDKSCTYPSLINYVYDNTYLAPVLSVGNQGHPTDLYKSSENLERDSKAPDECYRYLDQNNGAHHLLPETWSAGNCACAAV